MLAVVVARKVAERHARRKEQSPPVGKQVLVVGKAVVQKFRLHQVGIVQLVAQAVIHPVIVEKRLQMPGVFQLGKGLRRGGVEGGRIGKGVIPAAGHGQAAFLGGMEQRLQKLRMQ